MNDSQDDVFVWMIKLQFKLIWWSIKLPFQILLWLLSTKIGRGALIGVLVLLGINVLLGQVTDFFSSLFPQKTPSVETTIRVLYTNDEEGYLLPSSCANTGGVIPLTEMWIEREQCDVNDCLILSGGDVFISSPISSQTLGQSTIEIMQSMGYDAIGMGNHELDFGPENAARLSEEIPFLSANYVPLSPPNFSEPFKIFTVDGVRVAVVGLGTKDVIDNRKIKDASTILDLNLLDYEAALSKVVSDIDRGGGADLYILVGNIPPADLEVISTDRSDWNKFLLLLGGDDQIRYGSPVTGTHSGSSFSFQSPQILEAGENWNSYIRIDLNFDAENNFTDGNYTFFDNPFTTSEVLRDDYSTPTVRSIVNLVEKWRKEVYQDAPLGYLARPISHQEIVQKWYELYQPSYDIDVALSNRGGFRGCLSTGNIYAVDIQGLLPFDNSLVILEVDGDTLAQALSNNSNAIFWGIDIRDIDVSETYRLLTNSFVASGGDGFPFSEIPQSRVVDENWQEPTIEVVKSLLDAHSP